jgi:inorganic phosphate transporter, PiT family
VVFDDQLITASIILAGLIGAIVWNLMTWLLGLPSSSSHALFGGPYRGGHCAGIASVNGWVIVSKVLLPPSSRHWSPASRRLLQVEVASCHQR